MSIANMKERWYLEPSWLIHIIIGDIAISSLLGALLYLVIEAPSGLVIKYLLTKNQNSVKQDINGKSIDI